MRKNLNLSRVRTFHPKGVKCPTCGQHAIRLIIPKGVPDGDWTQAQCNRCAAEQGERAQAARPAVRRVSDRPPLGRIPFSTAFVVSSTGQPRSEVGGVMRDAFEWGWINQTGDVGTDGEYLWIGRL